MVELPKTEEELNTLIESKVNEATDKLIAKHNGEMATMRQKHTADLEKAKQQANLTAEELAKQKFEEQQQADQEELTQLRAYKKSNELGERLAKEGLPSYFKNDTRLLNANDNDLDRAIKDVKKEYEATLPRGANHSTVVNTNTTKPNASNDKNQLFGQVGEALKNALGD